MSKRISIVCVTMWKFGVAEKANVMLWNAAWILINRKARRNVRVNGKGSLTVDFSRTGLAKDCRKVHKGLPKLRWGSKKDSKESRAESWDSAVEKEQLYLNFKKIISTSIVFRVKIAETHIVHWYLKFIYWKIASKSIQSRVKTVETCIDIFDRNMRSHLESNLTRRERIAPQSENLFSDWEKDKKLV